MSAGKNKRGRDASRPRPARPKYRTLPVWVARITETVHTNGKVYANVVTKTGKPRTIQMKGTP